MSKTPTASLKSEIREKTSKIEALNAQTEDLSSQLATIQELLLAEEERRLNIEAELAELNRLKDRQDTKVELDFARAQMVEGELSGKVKQLENRLKYFEEAPLKAGLKKALFSTLRTIRRKLPLSEAIKLNIAKKLTGVAQRLLPPAQVTVLQNPEAMSLSTDTQFAFQETDNPVISIIVPVYNEISQTIDCLRSIYQQYVSVEYEVILADDKSTDPSYTLLQDIPGLRYFRNEENLHFLLNCNQNSAHARGEYIVFLNNDTWVKPGWLQNLYQTFLDIDDVGIVGSKLLYPTGELQEAGGIMWEDASGWNWGKGQNSDHPLYNFVRDADYVSGASLMIRAKLWRELGGFNENLEKAYYEDTDLCFRVRSMGYRVIYQPFSEVIHIEGLSSGTDLTEGAKQYQVINQKLFKDTWDSVLKNHLPNATTPYLASDRYVRGHILFIDAVTPEIDKDSGSVDAFYSMRLLVEQGFRVHFLPVSNFRYWNQATKNLQKIGVECVYHPFYEGLESYLEDRGDMFDYVIASRPECAKHFPTIKKYCPSAKTIYNTVDLHFMRMEREADLLDREDVRLAAQVMKKEEISYIKNSDATIILSKVEHSLLSQQKAIEDKLWIIPLIRTEAKRLVEYDKTQDIVFIGGYRHPPNVDAVEWLVKDIWPEIRKVLPGVKLQICGSSMPPHFQSFASDDVLIKGFVPDLDALLSQTRLTLAPLRFGAGLKGKVASSIGVGVPCIGTATAFEGMAEPRLSDVKFVASTPKSFASLAKKLYSDETTWTKASLAGVEYHNENYAYQNVSKTYMQMMESLK